MLSYIEGNTVVIGNLEEKIQADLCGGKKIKEYGRDNSRNVL